MFYSLLIILVIVAVIFSAKRWHRLDKDERKNMNKTILIWGGLGLVLVLIATGRAHWITGLLAGVVAVAARATQLAEYFPALKRYFPQGQASAYSNTSDFNTVMDRAQAADILGIDIDASKEDVRNAHKRLMQKLHPDRGGSELLAKQINQARDVLLQQ